MKKIFAFLLALSINASMLFVLPSYAAEAYTDTTGWTITTESIMGAFNDITKAIDGDINTYWHSKYYVEDGKVVGHDNPPYEIIIEFPEALEISGVRYVPRQKNNVDSTSGIWEKVEIYASADGSEYKLLREVTYDLAKSRATADRAIEKGSYKSMKFNVTAANNGYCTAAEIIMLKGDVKDTEAAAAENTEKPSASKEAESLTSEGKEGATQGDDGKYLTGKESWDVTVSSSKVKTDAYIRRPIDTDMEQHWHTDYTNEGSTITGKVNPPHFVDITFPEDRTFSGVVFVNRVTGTAGNPLKYSVYGSSDDSETWVFLESGTAVKGAVQVEALLNSNVTAKKVRFKINDSVDGYASCTEIEFMVSDVSKKTVALKDYKSSTAENESTSSDTKKEDAGASASNKDDVQGDDGTYLTGKGAWEVKLSGSKVKDEAYMRRPIDGDYVNYWHSDYKNEGSIIVSRDLPPHHIDITFPEVRELSGVEFTTRPDGEAGNPTKYAIYGCIDDSDDWVLIEEGTADEDNGKKMKMFAANIKAKRIRYEIIEGVGGYGSCAEIDFYKSNPAKKTVSLTEYTEIYDEIAVYEIPKENMTATANPPEFWLNHDAKGVLDETMVGFWQTATGAKAPFVLTIDLGGEYSIDSFDVAPRQSEDFHGNWDLFNVWVSQDGENYGLALENHSFERSTKVKNVKFDNPVKARYVEFEIVEGYTNKASCAEVTFYQSSEDYKDSQKSNFEKYVLKIGSPVIEVTKGAETKEVTLDVSPFIDEGYTLIPLRGLLEEMGAKIEWVDKNQSIIVENSLMKIEFQIWNNIVYVTGGRYGRVRYTLNQEPRIVEGRTFIPLRFCSEHLGYTVLWDGETQTITITNEQ
ncbi:MAG: discoidin domain-containing protein [Clostridia bacterium]|nr:discoidin domain-containing protein [Clostridia bacterium]